MILFVVCRWVELILVVCSCCIRRTWLHSYGSRCVLDIFELCKSSFNIAFLEGERGIAVQTWGSAVHTLPRDVHSWNAWISILEDAWQLIRNHGALVANLWHIAILKRLIVLQAFNRLVSFPCFVQILSVESISSLFWPHVQVSWKFRLASHRYHGLNV